MERFGVSKITIERAIQELANEGYLKRERGKGRGTVVISREGIENRKLVYLMMQMKGHLYHNLYLSLIENLSDNGYHILTYEWNVHPLEDKWEEMLSFAGEVMVINGLRNFPFHLLERTPRLPFLIFALTFEGKGEYPGAYVLPDMFQGGYLSAQHLLEREYDKIILFIFPEYQKHRSMREKIAGIEKALEEKGKAKLEVIEEPLEVPEGIKAEIVAEIIKKRGKNVGIICSEDYRASCVYFSLKNLGWNIPGDAGVVGFHNTPWTEILRPSLTSISVKEERIGAEVARLVKEKKEERVIIPPLLVERESTRR
jgi:DNA-binding LacI/PurR family transcriptional regulator